MSLRVSRAIFCATVRPHARPCASRQAAGCPSLGSPRERSQAPSQSACHAEHPAAAPVSRDVKIEPTAVGVAPCFLQMFDTARAQPVNFASHAPSPALASALAAEPVFSPLPSTKANEAALLRQPEPLAEASAARAFVVTGRTQYRGVQNRTQDWGNKASIAHPVAARLQFRASPTILVRALQSTPVHIRPGFGRACASGFR
jgi:hypothetical protein